MLDKDPVDFHALRLLDRLELALRSPAPFFVTGEDWIQLSALNSATGVILALSGRFVQLNGETTSFVHFLTPATDRTLSSITKSLGDGWIQNLTVVASSGTPLIGQCWARVQIVRGQNTTPDVLGTLVSGYVTAVQPIAFPVGQVRGTLDGPGVIRSITVADPAVGADWSTTVPSGARWRPLTVVYSFVTDATAVTRLSQLIFDDGTTTFESIQANNTQAASLGYSYFWSRDGADRAFLTYTSTHGRIGEYELLAGYRIGTSTAARQAGDQYSSIQLLVEEWLEGA